MSIVTRLFTAQTALGYRELADLNAFRHSIPGSSRCRRKDPEAATPCKLFKTVVDFVVFRCVSCFLDRGTGALSNSAQAVAPRSRTGGICHGQLVRETTGISEARPTSAAPNRDPLPKLYSTRTSKLYILQSFVIGRIMWKE